MSIDVVKGFFLAVHLIALASLILGLATQITETKKKINKAIFYGAWVQFLSGLVLTWLYFPNINFIKAGILVPALTFIVFFVSNNRKREFMKKDYLRIFALTIISLGIAMFWH